MCVFETLTQFPVSAEDGMELLGKAHLYIHVLCPISAMALGYSTTVGLLDHTAFLTSNSGMSASSFLNLSFSGNQCCNDVVSSCSEGT